jgi:hypothetical protein
MTAAEQMKEALEMIVRGLTSETNKCWPTVKPWTKKERDSAMLAVAKDALKAAAEEETNQAATCN